MKQLLTLIVTCCLAASGLAHDYIPGEPQSQPILLRGGDLYTVSSGVLANTDLLFENGRITAIGQSLTPPDNCEVIDVSGKHVYPGLIAIGTSLGLVEIGAVRATRDITEVGNITPEVATHVAYNPDSELLPAVRAHGVTTTLVVPGGRLLRGQSCLINLDGWTKEQAAEELTVGMHLSWPSVAVRNTWWESRTAEEQKKDMARAREAMHSAFDDARAYYLAKQADSTIDLDLRWEAMLPVFAGTMPVYIHANDYRQIEQAVHFADDYGFKMILVGGKEAWKAADILKEHDIPVVYGNVHSMPMRQDDSYDITFRTPKLLDDAGLDYCIALFSSWGTARLPFQAGQTVAFGLTPEKALRAITLSAAEILGVEEDLGSLDVGKKATIVVSDGDILNHLEHNVTMMWIEGRPVNLSSKQKELYEKYRVKEFKGDR